MKASTLLSRLWPFGRRATPTSTGSDVLAVRFDEQAAAPDLAAWCDGQVVLTEAVDGEVNTTIYVPTDKGPRPALPGDWIVREGEGSCRTCTPEEFSARYEPSDHRLA